MVTLDTNAVSASICAAPPLPTVKLDKVSHGGVGPVTSIGHNGFANRTITTLTSGEGLAGALQMLTAGVSTTITEATPQAGHTLDPIGRVGLGAEGYASVQ